MALEWERAIDIFEKVVLLLKQRRVWGYFRISCPSPVTEFKDITILLLHYIELFNRFKNVLKRTCIDLLKKIDSAAILASEYQIEFVLARGSVVPALENTF